MGVHPKNLRSVFQRFLSKKPSVSANKLEHLDPQGSCRSVRVASLGFLSESQQPGWGLCLRPVDCQAFFFSKDVLVAISRFFFGLIASTWDHQRWLESGGRDTSQRCSMFKSAKIQEARQDYRVASCTWSPWNHSEWLGMTFDSFPATSISRTSSLLLSKQESSGSFELHQLVKDRTNHVWLQHMSPQSAPAITGWILDFCHNSRCTILSVASWSSWCDFSDIFIPFDLLGEVLQWRSKKPFTKSTAKLGGCEPPPMIPVTTRMTLLLLVWGPSLCHCHPYCSNFCIRKSTRNSLMSKNLTRPHDL